MSTFGEYSRGQAAGSRDGDSEYVRLCGVVSNNIQQLSKNVATMQRLVGKLGTSEDISQLHNKLQQTEHSSQKIAKETISYIKQLKYLEGETPMERRQRKVQIDKLADNFSTALNNFQTIQKTAAEKERESVTRARAQSRGQQATSSPIGGFPDDSSLMAFDRTPGASGTMQIQSEEEVSVEMIEERERAIRQLESDIVGVNEIFRDLATMVHEQGDVIDSIEANVETAAVHVEDANVQLDKARNYQKAARKKMCFIIVILVIVAAIIGVIIYMSLRN